MEPDNAGFEDYDDSPRKVVAATPPVVGVNESTNMKNMEAEILQREIDNMIDDKTAVKAAIDAAASKAIREANMQRRVSQGNCLTMMMNKK